jgi:flavin-dependent dehydrogenase
LGDRRRDRVTDVDVAVIGAGPAGAAIAARLAASGREVVLIEQAPAWRWRACGVFSSPATVNALGRLGLDAATAARATRAIPAMRVETPRGAAFRLTYGDDGSLAASAVGFDRGALDPALVALAGSSGADVRRGLSVRRVALPAGRAPATLELTGGSGPERLTARVVVGADGSRSVVARAAGVSRRQRLADRAGLTFHVEDPVPGPHDARMVVFPGGYVGLAPVPGGRINVGIVLGGPWRDRLRRLGARAVAEQVVRDAEAVPGGCVEPCDEIAGAWPLGHRVTERAGAGWLLVGDAAGFLDPITGEGLHRSLVSAELAAAAIEATRGRPAPDLMAYERAMQRRFAGKDVLSLLVQAFLGRPALFEYAARRLEARSAVRETMGLVMGDLVPASRGLDPRFLAAMLAP